MKLGDIVRKCDYCNKEVDVGYLEYDTNVICEECLGGLYSSEELEEEYEKGNLFWTTFYKED